MAIKSLWGNGDKKSTIITILMSVILFCVVFSVTDVHAVIQNDSNPPVMQQDAGRNDGASPAQFQAVHDALERKIRMMYADTIRSMFDFLSSGSSPNVPPNNEPVPTIPGSGNITPTLPFPTSTLVIAPYNGQITYYRQCSPENQRAVMKAGCTLCDAGCGITAAATIASTLLRNTQYTPINVLSTYLARNYYVQCDGTNIQSAYNFLSSLDNTKIQLSNEYVLTSETGYIGAGQKIKSWTDAGWMIFMLGRFNGIGHFVVITAVDGNNNFTVYDPYYEYRQTTQPNSNLNRYKSNAVYRYAFAVRQK